MSKRLVMLENNPPSKKGKHWSLGLLDSILDPENVIHESKNALVIKDKYPKAKLHYLILSKEDISSIFKLRVEHIGLLDEFKELASRIQSENKSAKFKVGFHAVPSMQRLHMHVISTDMISPCLKTKQHWNTFHTDYFVPFEDLIEQLKQKGKIEKISEDKHKQLVTTPLKCNSCTYAPKNMPDLKKHLLTHNQ